MHFPKPLRQRILYRTPCRSTTDLPRSKSTLIRSPYTRSIHSQMRFAVGESCVMPILNLAQYSLNAWISRPSSSSLFARRVLSMSVITASNSASGRLSASTVPNKEVSHGVPECNPPRTAHRRWCFLWELRFSPRRWRAGIVCDGLRTMQPYQCFYWFLCCDTLFDQDSSMRKPFILHSALPRPTERSFSGDDDPEADDPLPPKTQDESSPTPYTRMTFTDRESTDEE